ncbi:heme/hemin ABC transporter substrate-binding protein [Algihabitans albus]|uniref:heme/hemin ABC transporter substrate-binding protein n=1 Tax=Algihabitans albus TaxID=2164067 RepID=UPI001ABCE389|nr:ABC transporter substrate-binding protein [Algihabitans albus]
MRHTKTWMLALLISGGIAVPAAAQEAQRVISVGGSITEIVYELGAGDRLVAVDTTSSYPPQADDLPDVGYMRQLSAEPILALEPDLLLLVEDAGPPATIEQLRAAGVAIVTLPDQPTLDGVRQKVRQVAAALDLVEDGEGLVTGIEAAQQDVAAKLADLPDRPSVLFLLSVGTGAPLAAGRETSAAGIIEMAGGRNALADFSGFRPLSPEAAAATRAEVVLVTERTLERFGGRDALLARPELAASPAATTGRLVAMDGLLLLGFGPRTPQAVAELAEALHPEIGEVR